MTKRKRKSNNAGDLDSVDGNKRSRQSPPLASQSISNGRVDPTYGQRSAIPGLDDDTYGDAESELAYEDEGGVTGDALAYLRSVRIEASGIPTLLVAPNGVNGSPEDDEGEGMRAAIYNNGIGDSRGYYEDGAYTAAPTEPVEPSSPFLDDGGQTQDPQAAYYATLLQRFSTLRERLKATPPRHAVERLDADHPSYMASSTADYKTWRWRLRNTEPVPAQLAGMDKGTVLKLLRILGRQKFIKQEKDALKMREQRRVALWVWGLLAKLPERGELASEEVGVVRELGKRAVWVGVEIKGLDMGGLDDGDRGSVEEDGAEEEEDGEDMLDVEVDIDDDEAGGPDEDVEDNQISANGDGAFEERYHDTEPPISSNAPDPEIPQVLSPILPTPAGNHTNPSSQPSPAAKPTPDPASATTPTTHEAHLLAPQDLNEEAQLTAARSQLLARLASHDAESGNEDINNANADVLQDADIACTEEADVDSRGERADGGGKEGEKGEGREEKESEEEHVIAFRATLDMIITIAGEVYGQRDLLEFREVWL